MFMRGANRCIPRLSVVQADWQRPEQPASRYCVFNRKQEPCWRSPRLAAGRFLLKRASVEVVGLFEASRPIVEM